MGCTASAPPKYDTAYAQQPAYLPPPAGYSAPPYANAPAPAYLPPPAGYSSSVPRAIGAPSYGGGALTEAGNQKYSAPFAFRRGVETEPMMLLDTTGSMNFPNKENDPTPRRDIIREAIGTLVGYLEAHDAQNEAEGGEGGLLTITFAGGRAAELGDLNTRNFRQKWASIEWKGGTKIMPGWRLMMETYEEEFGSKPDKPILMALVVTDGEAQDLDEFVMALKRSPSVYVTIALLGYGPEHNLAFASFQRLFEQEPQRVRIFPFESQTDPSLIAQSLISMVGGQSQLAAF